MEHQSYVYRYRSITMQVFSREPLTSVTKSAREHVCSLKTVRLLHSIITYRPIVAIAENGRKFMKCLRPKPTYIDFMTN